MASSAGSNPTTFELTQVESNIRQLLLDVATWIDETPAAENVGKEIKVPDELTKDKVVLRFTGGWVRDKLLGIGSHDIDVSINKLTGQHFGEKILEYLQLPENAAKHGLDAKKYGKPVQKLEEKAVQTSAEKSATGKNAKKGKDRQAANGMYTIQANPEKSKNLETASIPLMGIDLDLVNLRKEIYNEISRNPEMAFGTAEEDATRRDATVNAMFYNLNTSQIEDFTGHGFNDMQNKILRTPLEPYKTFKDDPLRILRLIRFSSRLHFDIDEAAEVAMGDKSIQEVLKVKISRERVGMELEKMLNGPDPRMALALIDRLGLYETVFTDPTRTLEYKPETGYFATAYTLVESLVQKTSEAIPAVIPETLLRNSEERYLAWICATVMPWVDAPTVPNPKPLQRPLYAAYLVAREGIKAPNKICDVIAASFKDGEEIRSFVEKCYSSSKRKDAANSEHDATTRDGCGMAIRRWGPTWRTQVLFSLIYELVLGSVSRERIFDSYATFLRKITEYGVLEAYTFKPLITGTELAKAMNTKPGPWMRDALDIVMAWQLRNPDVTDPAQAIEAVKSSRNSELPSLLAVYILELIIRPLFSQAKPSATSAAKRPIVDIHNGGGGAWKDGKNQAAMDLLRWTVETLDSKSVEANWKLLYPPILKLLDDLEIKWKVVGCELLNQLLRTVQPSFLSHNGLGPVFETTLRPFFAYLPTLTPEEDSAMLLDVTLSAMMQLADVMYSDDATGKKKRTRLLNDMVYTGVLAPLQHATPSTYPDLATTLLKHLAALFARLGISSVRHLPSILQQLSEILQNPFVLAKPPLVLTTILALRTLMENAWPRIGDHRTIIMAGVCKAWWRCCEEEAKDGQKKIDDIKERLIEVVAMMDVILAGDEGAREEWQREKQEIIKASPRMEGLFATTTTSE
ncbi:poly A polymerase C-terminal region-like protein [Pleomassaria siparia CBS 279.74]|uniref:Poly A polymerase C-terminal region-like protein n=1 Tax=Pleomassaria siparia CBS 279.74 TaxID=1314801 RepID=A0A6G1K8B2_9PLEO|nr:poly A polymerase C-terminal region-like protein [Pleomassaria siparia CBS 279.74]